MARSGTIGIGYTRKSVVQGRADETSIDRQAAALRAAIEADGLTPELYSDAEGHRSGRSDRDRPEWRAVMRRLAAPGVRALYVDSLSRAWRSTKGWNELLEACRRHQVRLRVLRENIDTEARFGAMETFYSNTMAGVAQFESDVAAERMRGTIAHLKASGVYWGQTPFGYIRSGEGLDAWLRPFNPHDGTVRLVLQLVAAGMSNARIAEHLNARGVRFVDRTGVPGLFNNETIRTIARNVLVYAGYVIAAGGRAKARRVELAPGSGSTIARYAEALGARRGQVEPLVDDQLASQVVGRLLHPASNNGRRPGEWIALLTPRLWCGTDKLWAQSMPHGHFYRSRRRAGPVIDADALDAEILQRLCGVSFPPEIRADIRQAIDDRETAEAMLRLRADQRKLQRMIDHLTDMRAAEELTREEYLRRRDEAAAQLADVERRLAAPGQADLLMQALEDLGALLQLATPAQAKGAVAAMFDRFEVTPEGEIARVTLARWAAEAFGEIAWAMRSWGLSNVPPTGLQDAIAMPHWPTRLNASTRWLLERIAA